MAFLNMMKQAHPMFPQSNKGGGGRFIPERSVGPQPEFMGVPILPGGRYLANGSVLDPNYKENIMRRMRSQGDSGGGGGNNSFLGTFMKLAKWAVPYTSDVIKKRRQTKLDQELEQKESFLDMMKNQTTSPNITRGTPAYAGQKNAGGGTGGGGSSGRRGSYPGIFTPFGKESPEFQKSTEEMKGKYGSFEGGRYVPTPDEMAKVKSDGSYGAENLPSTAGGISKDMQKVMLASQKTGAAMLNPVTGQVQDVTQPGGVNQAMSGQQPTDVLMPGQGEPGVNITPEGKAIAPTEEQLDQILEEGGGE